MLNLLLLLLLLVLVPPPLLPPFPLRSAQLWAGELASGAIAVVLVNTGAKAANVTATWNELGLALHAAAAVRDMWAHRELGTLTAR